MLRQPGLPSERQAQYLEILEQQCTQEINLITDLLKLQELESHQALNLQTIHLKPFIQNLAQSFEEKWADKGLNITVNTASLLFQTDTDSFERILQELFTNAGKYSDPDTTVVLRATYEVNQIIFTLTNFGTPRRIRAISLISSVAVKVLLNKPSKALVWAGSGKVLSTAFEWYHRCFQQPI